MDFFVKQIVKPNRPSRQPQNQIANTKGKPCPVLRCEMFTILLSKYFLENSLWLVGTYIGQRFVIWNYNVPFKIWKSSRTKRMKNDCPKRLKQFFKLLFCFAYLTIFKLVSIRKTTIPFTLLHGSGNIYSFSEAKISRVLFPINLVWIIAKLMYEM